MQQIDHQLLDALSERAKGVPRLRAHHNLHPRLTDPIQRLCVAIEPGSYVRPHRHMEPATMELFLLLRGEVAILLFDDRGQVRERLLLSVRGPRIAVEIPESAWHTVVALVGGSIFFEIKQGPYLPPAAENFAAWAPAEGEEGAQAWLAWARTAEVGEWAPSGGGVSRADQLGRGSGTPPGGAS